MTFGYCYLLNLSLGLYYHVASSGLIFHFNSHITFLNLIFHVNHLFLSFNTFGRHVFTLHTGYLQLTCIITPYKITYSRTFVLPSRNGQTCPLIVDSLQLISIYFTIQFISIYSIYSLILPPIRSAGCRGNCHLLVLYQ